MHPIITPKQVLALAFPEAEYLPESIISDIDIVAAQERYIVPILGAELTFKLATGHYQDLAVYYLSPALALATRLLVQGSINLRLGESGLVAPRGETIQPPEQSAVDALLKSLKVKLRQMLKRLSNYVNENAAEFTEYDPKCNILNRCSIDGGFVQTF